MATYDCFIFAGHGLSEVTGAYDPGATAQGARESDLTKLFLEEAKKELQSNPASKHLVIHYDEQNYVDNDLNGNTYKAKCGISIHVNAGGGTGTEVFVPCKEKYLEHDIALSSNISKLLGITNRGVKSRDYNSGQTFSRTDGQALNYTDYYKEIRQAWNLGISLSILEVGFIDSNDLPKMKTKAKEIGLEIAKYIAKCNGINLTNQQSSVTQSKPSTTTDVMYRVRKSWSNAKSQVGAYKDLNNAIAECKKHPGYKVYDEQGNVKYEEPSSQPVGQAIDPIQKEYAKNGKFTVTVSYIYFRNQPYVDNVNNPAQGTYNEGESVYYDKVVITKKYVWISWVSTSTGVRRYMPVKVVETGERWGIGV